MLDSLSLAIYDCRMDRQTYYERYREARKACNMVTEFWDRLRLLPLPLSAWGTYDACPGFTADRLSYWELARQSRAGSMTKLYLIRNYRRRLP